MGYEEFKQKLAARLKYFYGAGTEVKIDTVKRNNGQEYEGLMVVPKSIGARCSIAPVIRLDDFYYPYRNGEMDFDGCIERICSEIRRSEPSEHMFRGVNKLLDWNCIKDNIYPILLSTRENSEQLERLVSMPMLDLSVAYIIRCDVPEEYSGCVKISEKMLACYKVSREELHRQAIKNMERDGYEFRDIEPIVRNMMQGIMEIKEYVKAPLSMYILTNLKSYGAAGILNKKLLREFAGSRNYYILPSSLHETIFVPDDGGCSKERLDEMVKEVNAEMVEAEEILSDHSYYYDARTEEIRMCA